MRCFYKSFSSFRNEEAHMALILRKMSIVDVIAPLAMILQFSIIYQIYSYQRSFFNFWRAQQNNNLRKQQKSTTLNQWWDSYVEDILVFFRFSIIIGCETRNSVNYQIIDRDSNPVKREKMKYYIIRVIMM